MGRRAKNKQSAPEPLEPKVWPTAKKLGKRKADTEADTDGKTSSRVIKKIKNSGGKISSTESKAALNTAKGKAGRKESKLVTLQDADGDSGDGWEDVEGDIDMKAQYVLLSSNCCNLLTAISLGVAQILVTRNWKALQVILTTLKWTEAMSMF